MDCEPLLPKGITAEFQRVTTETIREVYRANAERHDPVLGDDMATFAFNGYRNSWYRLELAYEAAFGHDVRTSRPENSLLVEFNDFKFHIYRVGPSERIDIHALAIEGSPTKSLIGESNQLTLDLVGAGKASSLTPRDAGLRNLVIAHAGNPEDHCCAIWIGAPRPAEVPGISPWAWVVQIYRIDRGDGGQTASPNLGPSHDSREEPDVALSLRDEGEGVPEIGS